MFNANYCEQVKAIIGFFQKFTEEIALKDYWGVCAPDEHKQESTEVNILMKTNTPKLKPSVSAPFFPFFSQKKAIILQFRHCKGANNNMTGTNK